jgi:hypothetical protein
MFEVVVIENTVTNKKKPIAYWSEIFPTIEEAKMYYMEIFEQTNAYNSHLGTIAATVTMLIFNNSGSAWVPEPISIVEMP